MTEENKYPGFVNDFDRTLTDENCPSRAVEDEIMKWKAKGYASESHIRDNPDDRAIAFLDFEDEELAIFVKNTELDAVINFLKTMRGMA